MKIKETTFDVDIFMHKGENEKADGDNGLGAVHAVEHEQMTVIREDGKVTYIPFHAIDHEAVKETITEKDIEDDMCQSGETPQVDRITGATDTSINQGTDFDLMAGVKGYNADGEEIEVTVNPDEIDTCEVGTQEFTYTAGETTVTRKIKINSVGNPTISGLDNLTVEVGEEFDPLEGVTAKDGNGNDIEVEVVEEEPTDECELIAELGTSGSETSVIEKIVLGDTPLIDGEFYNYTLTKAYDPEAGDQNAQDYEGQEQADSSYFDGAIALPVRIGETAGIFVVYDGNELYAVPDDNGLAFETFTLCKPR